MGESLSVIVDPLTITSPITRTAIACPTATRVQSESQLVTALLGDAGAVEEDID
jgi:hypothetical protein